MADVTYNTASFPALVSTLTRLRDLAQHSDKAAGEGIRGDPPIVLLAYKQRHPDERTLWNLVSDIGLNLTEIDRVPGAGGAPIEIYLGQFTALAP